MDRQGLNRRQFIKVSGRQRPWRPPVSRGFSRRVGRRPTPRAPSFTSSAGSTSFPRRRRRAQAPGARRPRRRSGAEVTLEFINANDLQPRITAAVSVGLRRRHHPDALELAASLRQRASSTCRTSPSPSARRRAASTTCSSLRPGWAASGWPCPTRSVGNAVAYRRSWFNEVGAKEFPKTWDEYREVGKKLKAKGKPIGQTARPHLRRSRQTFAIRSCGTSAAPRSTRAARTSRSTPRARSSP